MRRIYESRAIHRDDADPFTPNETDRDGARWRSLNWEAASHALLPTGVRDRAIAVTVETDRDVYAVGDPVDVRVTMRNRLPIPVVLPTRSPVRWRWAVDDAVEAQRDDDAIPGDPALFAFARSERKTFSRRWPQRIHEASEGWLQVDAGEYDIEAWITVDDAVDRGLAAATTIRIE